MIKIQWEYDLVQLPFCEQLEEMGWEWIEGSLEHLYRSDGSVSGKAYQNRLGHP